MPAASPQPLVTCVLVQPAGADRNLGHGYRSHRPKATLKTSIRRHALLAGPDPFSGR